MLFQRIDIVVSPTGIQTATMIYLQRERRSHCNKRARLNCIYLENGGLKPPTKGERSRTSEQSSISLKDLIVTQSNEIKLIA
jgi:hypothetical protein